MDEIIAKKDAEIKYLKAEFELVKKLEGSEIQVKNSKLQSSKIFELIHSLISKFNLIRIVIHLYKVSNVSTSEYYRFSKSKNLRNTKEIKDIKTKDIILKGFDHREYKKGSRSIKTTIENEFNIQMNRNKIQRIMRMYSIIFPIRKANPSKRIAKATQEHHVIPNILNREFKQDILGKVLLTDITYMPYDNNKIAYLSTIKYSSTNEILAYYLSNNLEIELVKKTIDNLTNIKSFKLHKDVFIHSDQGSHYTNPIFKKLLKNHNIGQSMSIKGNC